MAYARLVAWIVVWWACVVRSSGWRHPTRGEPGRGDSGESPQIFARNILTPSSVPLQSTFRPHQSLYSPFSRPRQGVS